MVARLNPGESFSSGTLCVEGDGAQARLSYADGSTLWVSGGAELKLTKAKDKTLSLHAGNTACGRLSSAPRTSTGRFVRRLPRPQCWETSFALTAAKRETRLVVNEGEVSLRRLSDEQTLTVKANEQVKVGQEHAILFRAERSPSVPINWIMESKFEGSATLLGTWSDAGRLTATPETVFLKATGANEIHYRAGTRKLLSWTRRVER